MNVYVFVSDLHLGEGGPLEDFAFWPGRLPRRKTRESVRSAVDAMHGRWDGFVEHLISATGVAGKSVELVLLGDVFDLLQVEGDLCDPGKIRRVAEAHRPWFESLRRADRAGMRISWVVGNHDHELLDPAVWDALLEHVPFVNGPWNHGPLAAWRLDSLGLHAEHGSQLDPANAVIDFADPRVLSLGSHVVLDLLNPFEPRCPLLDLMPDVPTALWYALSHSPGMLARPLRDFLFGRTREELAEANYDFLPEVETLLHRVWMPKLPRPYRKLLRRILSVIADALGVSDSVPSGDAAGVAEAPRSRGAVRFHPMEKIRQTLERGRKEIRPPHLRRGRPRLLPTIPGAGEPVAAAFVPRRIVTGHTHRAGAVRGSGGLEWINTGSWKARAVPSGQTRFRIEQSLDVAVVREREPGDVQVEFLRWGEES